MQGSSCTPCARGQSVVSDEFPVADPLARHSAGDRGHDVDGVFVAEVVPGGELVHVAVQVLRGEGVECALVGALEHRPQGLDAVGVHIAPDVLGERVLDGIVVERERFADALESSL